MSGIGALKERFGAAGAHLGVVDEALLLGVSLLHAVERTGALSDTGLLEIPERLKDDRPLLSAQLERVFGGFDPTTLAALDGLGAVLLHDHPLETQRREAIRLYGEALDRIASDEEHVAISDPVARLLAGTLSTFTGVPPAFGRTRVLDPACGNGRLLAAAGEQLRSQGVDRFVLRGVEARPLHAALAELNMMLHDFPDAEIGTAPWTDTNFTAVLCVPPRGPWRDPSRTPYAQLALGVEKPDGNQFQDLTFLEDSIGRMTKGDMAFLLPAGILFRSGIHMLFRKHLSEKSWATAAVSFPIGLVRDLQVPFALLTVSTSNPWGERPLRLVDAAPTRTRTAEPLHDSGIQEILRALGREDSSLPAVDVFRQDLRNNEYIWQVNRYLEQVTTGGASLEDRVELLESIEMGLKWMERDLQEAREETDAALKGLRISLTKPT